MKMFPVVKLKSANPRPTPIPRNFLSIVYTEIEKKQAKIPFKLFQRKIKGIDQ